MSDNESDEVPTMEAMDAKKGDMIKFDRGVFNHYGIYVGDGEVIHRAAPPGGHSTAPASASSSSGVISDKAEIRKDKLVSVAGDSGRAEVDNFLDGKRERHSRHEIVRRAESKVGERGYNLLSHNCEHFATECRYGEEISEQVEEAAIVIVVTAILVGAFALIGSLFRGSSNSQRN